MKLHDVAVVGATGLVGRAMVAVMEERKFPVNRLVLLASERSVGHEIAFNSKPHPVHKLEPDRFKHIEYALFAAGATVSATYAPVAAVKYGAIVIDNSSSFRQDEKVPLVVPEVNRKQIFKHSGIIANPNCSTIQMVVVLKPLHDAFNVKRVVVSTYQSVTGAGKRGYDQLHDELAGRPPKEKQFPHQIAFNSLPHVDIFFDDGYSKEEFKMMNETKKIMGENIRVTATCVRIPVTGGHSESLNVEFEKKCTSEEVREVLRGAPGIVVQDDPKNNVYPMPLSAFEKDDVFVGRIRKDETVKSGVNLWIVADNVRKGAATNAVQIMEALALGK
ncbi:MAG: aspartate-semialdehyde dehydrogenase [Ignavibacteriales bacterium]|nr:aspartate-semialdehyde dehydrogenase [Ignavibacteriales bacterium]MBI3005674.1 aspartate-semialdehyde dehydrogenase [Ignavibacteriales bacterium]